MMAPKRCQVCGQQFDPNNADEWACTVAYRARHVPTDRPGTVYVLHFDQPTDVAEADRSHIQPTTHYVGWTSQDVAQRVRQHQVPESSMVRTWQGTADDEAALKRTGACPQCGHSARSEVPRWALTLSNSKRGNRNL